MDDKKKVFKTVVWSEYDFGSWSDPPQEIPDGKQIIGLKLHQSFLRLGFTYWERPPYAP